jgi:formylglycine-generating enzyme required for sulfatase activity
MPTASPLLARAFALIALVWLLQACALGFDTTVPSGLPDVDADAGGTGDTGSVDASEDADPGDAEPGDAEPDTGPPEDGGTDTDRPDTDPADTGDIDLPDTPPPPGCELLGCTQLGRTCVPVDDESGRVVCGACLEGLLPVSEDEGAACAPVDCNPELDAEECPEQVPTAWSVCGGFSGTCGDTGTRTRTEFRAVCLSRACTWVATEVSETCDRTPSSDDSPCEVADFVGRCSAGTCELGVGGVQGLQASQGDSAQAVDLKWEPLDGAAGYVVFRDDVQVTPEPLLWDTTTWADTGAAPGPAPGAPTAMRATRDNDGGVLLTWEAPPVPPGPSHRYRVAAVLDGGRLSTPSAEAVGWRAGLPITGYEVTIDGGPWISAGTASPWLDTDAPAGRIQAGSAQASDGTEPDRVLLEALDVILEPAPSRRYEVRAQHPAGASPPSLPAEGARVSGPLAFQWERSSGTTATDFNPLAGLTSNPAEDTTAPSNGAVRHYRAVLSGPGLERALTTSDPGWRATTAGTLTAGRPCTRSADCAPGLWCPAAEDTIAAHRRCAPLVLDGERPLRFLYMEAGTFTSGTPTLSVPRESNEPQRQVTLSRPFFMTQTEVSIAHWRRVTRLDPVGAEGDRCGESCPATRVSWWSAIAWANALSEAERLAPCYSFRGLSCTGRFEDGTLSCGAVMPQLAGGSAVEDTVHYECEGYRLCAEAEWEYATRAGTTGDTWAGNLSGLLPTDYGCNGNASLLGPIAWYCGNSANSLQAVAGRLRNPWGLRDPLGNAWEWVWDRYVANPGTARVTDPIVSGGSGDRTMRGGGFTDQARDIRAARRTNAAASTTARDIGFRLCRTLRGVGM